ncbi:hypothetical protein E2C01_043657 [Portunus trituberculatus]|uniref:Uncharacterized protein n=1 Tax=Portunus trituberculatus TaxID=210409 RepID=A0A5B7FTI3_PORTR|nr:hypothetical protein [Portunus trituberculatus]
MRRNASDSTHLIKLHEWNSPKPVLTKHYSKQLEGREKLVKMPQNAKLHRSCFSKR